MNIKLVSLITYVLIWIGLVGIKNNAISISFTIIVPLLVYFFSSKLSLLPKRKVFTVIKFIKYSLWLIKEIFKSSFSVSKLVWKKNTNIPYSIQPIISQQTSELGIVIYANSITITPGTVTLKVEENKLLVHALDINFMEDLQDGTMDKKILNSVYN